MISHIAPSTRCAISAHALLYTPVMNKLLTLALSLPMVACVIGSGADTTTSGTGGNGDGTGSGTGAGTGTGTSAGHITANTTWTGTVNVTQQTTVDPNVTLTIAAGTAVVIAPQMEIAVQGSVDIQGTKQSLVQISPTSSGGHHYGFSVASGGSLNMDYAEQIGGGITVEGGTVNITDSKLSGASGDLLIVGSGQVTMVYSAIGLETGIDSTHCDMHFGGSGTTISITKSNISASQYGLMLYGGNQVDLTSNNWFTNTIQIDTQPQVSGDISGGWFDNGVPTAGAGATLVSTPNAPGRLTDAGPR